MISVVGIEFAPQSTDEYFDDVTVTIEVLIVKVLRQCSLGHHPTRLEHHVLPGAVLECGKFNSAISDPHFLRFDIESYRRTVELRLTPAGRSPYQGLEAGNQLFDMKRFDQIIVGAGVEPLDFLLPPSACRENENRV